ncbi:MAG: pantothenate kinase [Marinilabiliales bacterium]|nr:MAG: pantothenate kinase [Marinilabiliales bacterium]
MKLVVDIGNTLIKLAVFKQDEIVFNSSFEYFGEKELQEILKQFPIKAAIMSSVREDNKKIMEIISSSIQTLMLDHNTRLPVENNYLSKESLGRDRIALMAGASVMFPNENVLVIDAGTCITYDLLNKNNKYYGGAISPGLKMRLKALNHYTSKLPLIDLKENHIPELIGNTTENSILSGVIRGCAGEINSIIESYTVVNKQLRVLLTGGDYKYFDKLLKYKTFAAPNLVLIGLKGIMDFNEKI